MWFFGNHTERQVVVPDQKASEAWANLGRFFPAMFQRPIRLVAKFLGFRVQSPNIGPEGNT